MEDGKSFNFCFVKIYLKEKVTEMEGGREAKRDGEILYVLMHFSDDCNSWSWMKPRGRDSF